MLEEDVLNEFLTAFYIISDIHRHKQKMMLLGRDKNAIFHLRFLSTILDYMQNDIDKYKEEVEESLEVQNFTSILNL